MDNPVARLVDRHKLATLVFSLVMVGIGFYTFHAHFLDEHSWISNALMGFFGAVFVLTAFKSAVEAQSLAKRLREIEDETDTVRQAT